DRGFFEASQQLALAMIQGEKGTCPHGLAVAVGWGVCVCVCVCCGGGGGGETRKEGMAGALAGGDRAASTVVCGNCKLIKLWRARLWANNGGPASPSLLPSGLG